MLRKIVLLGFVACLTTSVVAQNSNSSSTNRARSTGTSTNKAADPPKPAVTRSATPVVTRSATTPPATPKAPPPAKPKVAAPRAPEVDTVTAAFERLINGIRKADVKLVTGIYLNSPNLVLFNNNGTVTRGWEQMRKNRESSYPDVKDVKLDIRDLAVTMLGRDGAVVTCLWTQSQTFKDVPETATGRMTLVFKRVGADWKAVHLHTSPDRPDPSRVLPSEQTSTPTPTPMPNL